MEIAGGPNRVSEYTSVGFVGVPESLYMKNYNGTLGDISRLIHEGGHAIHEQLMSDNQIVPSYKYGPSIMYEAYAMFNELLLLDALEKQEKTNTGKAFYTKQFLDKLSHEIFTSAEEGAFEQGVYDGVAGGSINTREDVDKLYAGIMNKYDSYFPTEPLRQSEWINKRLVFDDPLYNVNYLYAILVSCKLYQQQHADPKAFAVKYTALLKNGFDAPADDLLKKFMGFSLDSGSLLKDALGLMKDKTGKLEGLYGK
jgi:oligoendopeptidase F